MIERLKNWVKNWLTSYLFCSVNARDVVTYNDKTNLLYLGGEQIGKLEAHSLLEEVRFLEKTKVWQIMQETLRSQAMEKAFKSSVNFQDLLTAKLMLYNLDVQKKICDTVRKVNGNP